MIFACKTSTAQIMFQKTYGGVNNDYGTYVQQTSDSGYIMTGYTNNFGAGAFDDIYLIRTKQNGDTIWTKTYGGSGMERSYAVQQTSDGGFIITGFTDSFGAGNDDIYLIRTDANGTTTWSKTYGGSGLDIGYAVRQTSDGGFIVAGVTDLGTGNGDLYFIKTKANGDTLFTKIIGGTGIDRASSIEETTDGSFIIGGYTTSFGAGGNDFYLLKLAANGSLLWSKTYGGTESDMGSFVRQTSDGGYIFVGNTMSFGAGAYDVYLIKTDLNGNLSWAKTYGGANSEYGNAVQQTSDGGYIVGGYSTSFGGDYLIKTDGNGNPLWSKKLGGTVFDWGNSMQQTNDGGFIIAGYTMSFGAGNMDVSLIKTDASGSSGCFEGNAATITGTPATVTGTPVELVTYGGAISTPATLSNAGGTVTTVCFVVGVSEKSSGSTLLISPNPFNTELSIQGTKRNGIVTIYDMNGKEVLRQSTTEGDSHLDTEGFNPGIYLMNYLDEESSRSYKIIKQ